MNGALIGLATVLGLIACLNLLLTYGLIRRVREHDRQLAEAGGGPVSPAPGPRIGTPLRAFATETVDGLRLTEQDFTSGVAYLGFFSTTCPPCREQLPKFADTVTRHGRSRTLVVVVTDDHPGGNEAGSFVEIARAAGLVVVVEKPLGPVAGALEVSRLPTMIVLDDGVVAASGTSADRLPVPVHP